MRRSSVISIEQKQELKEAFNEFDRDGSGFINTKVEAINRSLFTIISNENLLMIFFTMIISNQD